jgi:pilus assembly protein CpaE
MTAVAIISPDSAYGEKVASAAPELAGPHLRRWKEEYSRIDPVKVVGDTAGDGVGVVCIGPGLPAQLVLELASAFDRDRPELCVLLAAEPSARLWRYAAQVGVRDIVPPDAEPDVIRGAFERALETAQRRRANVMAEILPERPASRVITVLSPKGGSGKTTVATNLAVGLAGAMGGKVAVVDLDVQFGDVATALQLSPTHTMADVAAAGSIEPTLLKVLLTAHGSGLFALCGAESPAEGDDVTYGHALETLRLLAQEFAVVVVDTAAGIDERTLAAIEVSTDLLLVCTSDVASVRSLRKELDALDRLGMTAARRHFLLNRADARVGLEPADVEAAVGMKVALSLPSSRSVPLSMNLGSPVIESDPRSPVARQLRELVEQFADRPAGAGAPLGGETRRRWRSGR